MNHFVRFCCEDTPQNQNDFLSLIGSVKRNYNNTLDMSILHFSWNKWGLNNISVLLIFICSFVCCKQSSSSNQTNTTAELREEFSPISSCQLLSKSEWTKVLGEITNGPDETNNTDNFSMCSVTGKNGSVLLMVRQPEIAHHTTSDQLANSLSDSAKNDPERVQMNATNYVALTDLEVPAAYIDIRGVAIWLECYKNDTYLRVQASELDVAKAIAQLALTKL